jgi:ubiquinone/menaquinone biosynthesis C-methylase UbiE
MLDHLARRAARAGVHDIAPTIGDAGSLPFAPASFDAAYLIDVLGEVGDARATLRELRRTLRPGGRLAVGERFVDPDVVRLRTLVAIAHEAGFTLDGRRGTPPIYLARFRAAGRS